MCYSVKRMFEKNPSDLIEYHTSQGPNYNFAAFSKGTTGECMCTCESKRVSRLGVGVSLYVFFKGVWINRANSDLDSLCPRQDQTLAPMVHHLPTIIYVPIRYVC